MAIARWVGKETATFMAYRPTYEPDETINEENVLEGSLPIMEATIDGQNVLGWDLLINVLRSACSAMAVQMGAFEPSALSAFVVGMLGWTLGTDGVGWDKRIDGTIQVPGVNDYLYTSHVEDVQLVLGELLQVMGYSQIWDVIVERWNALGQEASSWTDARDDSWLMDVQDVIDILTLTTLHATSSDGG